MSDVRLSVNRRVPLRLILLSALIAAGCTGLLSQPPPANPDQLAPQFESCTIVGASGTQMLLPHYLITSTLPNREELLRVGHLMEGALRMYRTLCPDVPLDGHPMQCFVFENRRQWESFTRSHTGADAAIYLRVNRGGYTVGDWFVAYWIGSTGTYSVAAHEGFHQFVARQFKGRLPPFLEEGLACLFEQVQWEGEQPQWNLTINEARLSALRAGIDQEALYPLADLIQMHAGQVVGKRGAQIEAFYAQSWVFARFLNDGDKGSHRLALQQMLADAAAGTLYADSSGASAAAPFWDPQSARPMLEHYLQMDFDQIDKAYSRYIYQITASPWNPSGG